MRSHKKNSYYKLCLIHELGVFAAKIHTQIKMPKENYIFLIQSLDSNLNTRIVLINEFACMDKAAVVIVLDTLYALQHVKLQLQNIIQITSFARIIHVNIKLKWLIYI